MGSFTCFCNLGYTGDGVNCTSKLLRMKKKCFTVIDVHCPFLQITDIDECELSTPCDSNANCTDTVGSFDCFCNVGYSGNGLVCISKYFGEHYMHYYDTSSFTHFAHSATSSVAYTSNLACIGQLSVQSCCAPRLGLLQPHACMLLTNCVHFSYCSPIASASASAPRSRPFHSCFYLVASISAAASRLRPFQLLLPFSFEKIPVN